MNILMATTNWYPSGGDWTYINSINSLYEQHGHTIVPFAMKNEKNYSTTYNDYFLESIDYHALNENKSYRGGVKVLSKSIYSSEAKVKLSDLLTKEKVDIAQLNNINNIHTPSIIDILRKRKIPIVWRILDYKLICPNRTFLSDGTICESCYKHRYYQCIRKRCKKGSILASSIASLESYLYWILPHYRNVDMFMFQSPFTRDMFVKYGFNSKKTTIIENPFDSSIIKPEYDSEGYILYFGRLSAEKGVLTLLKAMIMLPELQLKIVGEGPGKSEYSNFINDNNMTNVTFLGPLWEEDLQPVLANSSFVIVPSEWYDPNPYVVLQSYAAGKPVIASKIGGLQDMVKHKKTGILFEMKNVKQLASNIKSLMSDQSRIYEYGQNARSQVENINSPQKYYSVTMELFEGLIKRKKK